MATQLERAAKFKALHGRLPSSSRRAAAAAMNYSAPQNDMSVARVAACGRLCPPVVWGQSLPQQLHCLIHAAPSTLMKSFVPSLPVRRSHREPPSRSSRTSMSKNGQHKRS